MAADGVLVAQKSSGETDNKISIHNFSPVILDSRVHFHVMKMDGSLFVWIGRNPELENLAIAMCTKYEATPSVARLIGDMSDITSSTLAQKVAKKSKKQCFVSYNLPPENELLGLTEKALFEEMNKHPEQF